MRWIALACLAPLAACDALFQLDHLDPPEADANGDGGPDEIDATPCVGHNEDGDAYPDDCDKCPIEGGLDNQADQDGDGVGDNCDPHGSIAIDKLVVFSPFTSLTGWTGTGVTDGENARLQSAAAKLVTSFPSVNVVTVPLALAGGTTAADSFFIYLVTTGTTFECGVYPGQCGTGLTGSCLFANTNGAGVVATSMVATIAILARLQIERNGAMIECQARDPSGNVLGTIPSPATLAGSGQATLQVNNAMVATVHSVVIYGNIQ